MDFEQEEAELRRTIASMADHDPMGLRQMLLDRIADSFKSEAGNTNDVSAALFGREAEQGVRLLQLLDRRYAVVVTNPPYMGGKNMDTPLKKYVERYYSSGKRDLYSSFIVRCLELCLPNGRVAMVTMQSWMFLRSFVDLRAVPNERLSEAYKKCEFTGLLRETSLEGLVHLGRYAFSEIGNAIVAPILFTMQHTPPVSNHQIWACRLTAPRPSEEQAALLLKVAKLGRVTGMLFKPYQADFLTIPETPIIYWLRPNFFKKLRSSYLLRNIAEIRQGLATGDNERFTRCYWEISSHGEVNECKPISGRWFWYAKGGGFCKCAGLEWICIDWEHNGSRLSSFPASVLRSPEFYFRPGLTYSLMARGSLAMRVMDKALFDMAGIAVFPNRIIKRSSIAALTSVHIASYLLRVIIQDLKFSVGYVANLTLDSNISLHLLTSIGDFCIILKHHLIAQTLTERKFVNLSMEESYGIQTLLHSLEGLNEQVVSSAYVLEEADLEAVLEETGTPAGWYPFIFGYDTLPTLPTYFGLPPLPQEVLEYLVTHERISPADKELAGIKANLRALYVEGPGAKNVDHEETDESAEDSEGQEEVASGAHIPIPTETFLEELSVKMQIHPISVYWLLEELKAE